MSVTLLPLAPGVSLSVVISGQMPARHPRIEHAWATALTGNPRLFDGPILAVKELDAERGIVSASHDRFAHVVCQPPDRAQPTTILSVTGVLESMANGRPSVLLAQRGLETRSYPGMWEFAPAGGLHAPNSRDTLHLDDFLHTLREELAEEAGITQPPHDARAIALVADQAATSVDIIVHARLEGAAPAPAVSGDHAWECIQACWVGIEQLDAFLATAPGGVIEPTRAIARFLGWTLA